MKKTFETSGTFNQIYTTIDNNMLEVVNALFRLAYPLNNLLGLALGDEPTTPTIGDSYLVTEDGTVWGVEVLEDEFLRYSATGWEVLPLKLPDLALGLSAATVASAVEVTPFEGVESTNVQNALVEINGKIGGTVAAGSVTVTPVGNIESTDVQSALAELDTNFTTALGDIETLLASI
jgi:hypothetical protein